MRGKETEVIVQMETQTSVREWCVQAEKIVAYPQDFGLKRSQVAGLASRLAEERRALAHQSSVSRTANTPQPTRVPA
jgi:hypothetical protein